MPDRAGGAEHATRPFSLETESLFALPKVRLLTLGAPLPALMGAVTFSPLADFFLRRLLFSAPSETALPPAPLPGSDDVPLKERSFFRVPLEHRHVDTL